MWKIAHSDRDICLAENVCEPLIHNSSVRFLGQNEDDVVSELENRVLLWNKKVHVRDTVYGGHPMAFYPISLLEPDILHNYA